MGQTNAFDARLNHCLRQLAAGEAGARVLAPGARLMRAAACDGAAPFFSAGAGASPFRPTVTATILSTPPPGRGEPLRRMARAASVALEKVTVADMLRIVRER